MNDLASGWWPSAEQRVSPHADERLAEARVDLLVIHAISLPPDEFGGPEVDALFMGELDSFAHPALAALAGLRVSAHFFIRRTGRIVQYVDVRRRAWHAGVSSFGGREACNDRSVGIELEGTDRCHFTTDQYRSLAALAADLMNTFPAMTLSRIVGHADIAPGRKTDPGPWFDWVGFRAAVLGLRIARTQFPDIPGAGHAAGGN